MYLDVLVFAAHPDDAELSMGGTIAKLTKNNYKVGIVDLTRGELGTRGTVEIRQKEAFLAAVLGIDFSLQGDQAMQQGLGGWRAAWHIYIHWDVLVYTSNHVIALLESFRKRKSFNS